MRYLFISPNFPPNFKHFIFRLVERGAQVFGLGSDSYDRLDAQLKNSFTAYQQVFDLEDYDQVFKAVAGLKARFGKMDRIESHNEYWLELDARLRTDFNVYGPKLEDMPKLKLKSKMKEVFTTLKLASAPGETFNTYDEAQALTKKYNFPVVVKPDKGVGAQDTYRLNSLEELRDFFTIKPDKHFIMEAFIDAQIETYDGLVDQKGKIVFENAYVYDSGVMDNVLLGKDMYYYTQRSIPADLKVQGKKILKGLGLVERFFHIEFFRLADGSLMVLELNARPPGGMSVDMMNFSSDCDLYDAYAACVMNQDLKLSTRKPYYCIYVGIKNHNLRKHVYSIDQILQDHARGLVFNGSNPSLFGPAIGDYAYVMRLEKIEPLLQVADKVFMMKEVD